MNLLVVLASALAVACSCGLVTQGARAAPASPAKGDDCPILEPADALLLEPRGFPKDDYEKAVARALLLEGPPLLYMVDIPSRGPETAVYLMASDAGCRVTRSRGNDSVWMKGGYKSYLPDHGGFEGSLPEAVRTTALISRTTCEQLRRLWAVALDARKPEGPTSMMTPNGTFCAVIHMDGTDFHFGDQTAGAWRAGAAPRGRAQPNVKALVALAQDLGQYTYAAAGERASLDGDLGRRAAELAERFRQAPGDPPR